ncbi:MAG: sigma-54 dependent transcriptional regulator, partial [Thermodesulfobacteriota bacterium]|nr:sigma-54 dependent transcriptional regulator [Thermodesulfobacteriota bacterium]
MQQLKRLLIRVAKTDAAILLHGETGVGKELVARAIHQHSPRNKEIFVPVDCATISEKILESELFGHRKGSFTGAEADKEGLFLAADQGSLFLDEIGEFQLELQAKLLRVLQERQVRPVGSNKASAINIRLIAATNKNLLQEVEQGHFRSDLYYRLAAIEIEVPPLRERCDDIPLLVAPLLQRQTLDPDCSFSPQAMEQLKRYNWPGNIRELENVITRAVTLCEGQSITLADLPAKIRQNQPTTATACLDSFEKTALESALDQARGNRRQAAEQLGISEATLYRKLKKAGLS